MAKLHSEIEGDIGMKKVLTKPKELQGSRLRLDEEALSRCYKVLKQWESILNSCDSWVSSSSGIKVF